MAMIDIPKVSGLLSELEATPTEARINILRRAVMQNGGRWDLPAEDAEEYNPTLKEVQVFGVFAMAHDVEDLPRNWMRAAVNILSEIEGSAA